MMKLKGVGEKKEATFLNKYFDRADKDAEGGITYFSTVTNAKNQ
jgi:hypothetical protein